MSGGRGENTLLLALQLVLLWAWLLCIPSIFGNSAHGAQAGRKLSTEIPGFISIDCGVNEDYDDKGNGIYYKSDMEFIDTGKNMPVAESSSQNINIRMRNLRNFPEGIKNCYSLKPENGKGEMYLIRAHFAYGNYDGKNRPPTFDLYLGVNKWVTVSTETEHYQEIIHYSFTDKIDVCLINTGSGIPFISVLLLRHLNNSIYKIESGALATVWRYDVGGSREVIRYKDDVYDRVWNPPDRLKFSTWYPISTQSTIDTPRSNNTYFPPELVLKTAAQSQNYSVPLNFSWSPGDKTSEYYVFFHFAEIELLEGGQLRELNISLSGEYPLLEPIKLEYLKPLTIGPLNWKVKDENLVFSIYATNESKHPPILNAVEIFQQIMLPNSPTDQEDVDAILDIMKVYDVTRNWQGDPCIPSSYSWDGLKCINNNISRIILLNLASSGLSGTIDSSFSNLKSIESLDLSNNNLTGPVPEFFAQMPSLRTLNLTSNKLNGLIPQAVMEDESLLLSVDENPYLCLPPSCKTKKTRKFVVPVVASIASLLIMFLLSALFWICWNCKRRIQGSGSGLFRAGSLESTNREFTYSQVVSITDNFRTVIGEGGFGKVYLGTLNDIQVAVKLSSTLSAEGHKALHTEAKLLIRTHHRSLVSLIGYCIEGNNMALLYEYMANGNLQQHLSETTKDVLYWQTRLRIAIDAAEGLHYLHNGCKPPVLHRDVKTQNILLDEYFRAKIADFGLSRNVKSEHDTHVSTGRAGTPAYIDPEYYKTGRFRRKSDVYSFGVVLLELISGLGPVIKGVDYINIIEWVSPFIQRGDIKTIVDQRLHGQFSIDSAKKAVDIAMSCVHSAAIQRPDISTVLAGLNECLAMEMTASWSQSIVANTSGTAPFGVDEKAPNSSKYDTC